MRGRSTGGLRIYTQWCSGKFETGGMIRSPLPLPSPPPLLFPRVLLPLPSIRSRPASIQLAGRRERCKLPRRGLAESQVKSNLVHFSFKLWYLVATISMIFWESTYQISIFWYHLERSPSITPLFTHLLKTHTVAYTASLYLKRRLLIV